ncbi:MAG: bactofilin family protein [Bacillota bacterium]
MLGKKDGRDLNLEKIDTIVGKDTEFKGVLNSAGVLRIDGKVEGEIHHRGDLVIGETGVIVATIIQARHISIAGQVKGNVEADGKLELVTSGRLYGDIKVAGLIIGEGAVFRGNSEMKTGDEKSTPKPKPSPA